MLRKIIFLALVASTAFADKPSTTSEVISKTLSDKTTHKAGTVVDLDTSETQKIISGQEELLKKVAEDRVDSLDEKSDVVANYETGTPVSQGNLYYYYYPVAAYPVEGPHHSSASDKVSAASSAGGLLDGPVLYILVPLVLLLVVGAVVGLFVTSGTTTTGRSFDGSTGRNSDLDEKFGSFAELQNAIDSQLSKYMHALDSENCMDRIVCELGTKASNIPHKNLFYSVVEWLAPEHGLLGYGRMTILKQAASGKYTMESCKKFACNPPASIQE